MEVFILNIIKLNGIIEAHLKHNCSILAKIYFYKKYHSDCYNTAPSQLKYRLFYWLYLTILICRWWGQGNIDGFMFSGMHLDSLLTIVICNLVWNAMPYAVTYWMIIY